jgi:hypothetical protein
VLTYRKTKDGEWVASGPATEVVIGQVQVTTKAGKTKVETVIRLGRVFDVAGVPTVYGYLAAKAPPVYASSNRYGASEGSPSRRARRGCGYPGCDGVRFCDECSE